MNIPSIDRINVPENWEEGANDLKQPAAIPESLSAYFRQPYTIFNLLWILYLSYLTIVVATDYQTISGRYHLPFALIAMDMVDLFIHEAGHFFFSLFGQIIYFMGGSLFQIILPVATSIVFARSSVRSMSFTLFWIGESIVNVSIYIADAPYKRLHLISRHATHDWNWLSIRLGILNDAETISSIVNFIGILTCIGAIIVGVYCIIKDILDVQTSAKIYRKKTVPGIHR